MHPMIRQLESEMELDKERFCFGVGDTIRVTSRVREGDRERLQAFEGTVIRICKGGPRTTVTVRKTTHGVGVERIFPIYAPTIAKIERISRHRIRRAKLYYLRDRIGKKAKLKEIRPGR